MGVKLIKISAVYFVLGVLLGMYMSITHSYDYASVHAHVNLLGWASLALAGVIYVLSPQPGNPPPAKCILAAQYRSACHDDRTRTAGKRYGIGRAGHCRWRRSGNAGHSGFPLQCANPC